MKVWHNLSFQKIFWLSIFIWISQGLYTFILPLLIYNKTGSVINMSFAKAMEFLPNIILAPLIGVIIDYANTKKVLLFSLLGQLLSLFLIITLILQDYINIIYFGIFIFMLFNIFFNNIRTLIVKFSVEKDLLIQANSYLQTTMQVLQVSIPLIAGFMIMFLGFFGSLAFGLIMIALAFILSLKIHIKREVSTKLPSINFREIFIEPIKAVYNNKTLWRFSLLGMFVNIAEGSSNVMYVFIFKSILNLSDGNLGLCFTVIGIGAILGGYLTPKIRKYVKSDEKVMILCLLSVITCYGFIFFSFNIFLLLFGILIQNICFTIISIYIWTIRQEQASNMNIGRITGITSAIFKLGMPIAIPLSGLIAYSYGVPYVFLFCQIFLILSILLFIKSKRSF